MAKMNLEEFKNKYNEKIVDNDDLLIELFEDVSDSFNSNDEEINSLKEEIAKKEAEVEELKRKYKERFLTSTEEQEEEEEKVLEEKEVIDVKEI